MKKTPEQQLLWELIRCHYGTGDTAKLRLLAGRCDVDFLQRLTSLTGIEGFLYEVCCGQTFRELLPPEFVTFLHHRAGVVAVQNDFVLQNGLSVVKLFNDHRIDYILIKGIVNLKLLYDDPMMRTVSDLDIVIKREDYPAVRTLLSGDGFYYSQEIMERHNMKLSREEYETAFHEISYFKDTLPFPTALDLHFNLSGFRENSLMSRLYPIGEHDWFGSIQILNINGCNIRCLDLEMALLQMMYHYSRHSFRSLKWLLDLCQMVVKYNDQIDWRRVYRTAANPNLRKLVGICLTMVHEVTGINHFGEYCLNNFIRKNVAIEMYQSMAFADIQPMKARIRGKVVRLGLSDTWSDKMRILGYTLFDRDSISHRIETKKRAGIDPLQPFRLIRLIVKDTMHEKNRSI